jgi:peroxiredoxin Q/BCP
LRDNYNALLEQGYVVIGISPDGEVSHQKFANRFKLPFSLIADEKREIINLYDVWGKKKLFGISYTGLLRTTFLINEKGIIEKVITHVKTLDHSSQILKPN